MYEQYIYVCKREFSSVPRATEQNFVTHILTIKGFVFFFFFFLGLQPTGSEHLTGVMAHKALWGKETFFLVEHTALNRL